MSENTSYIGVNLPKDLVDFIDTEAKNDCRSRTKQVEHFLQEMRRIRVHNRAAMLDKNRNGLKAGYTEKV